MDLSTRLLQPMEGFPSLSCVPPSLSSLGVSEGLYSTNEDKVEEELRQESCSYASALLRHKAKHGIRPAPADQIRSSSWQNVSRNIKYMDSLYDATFHTWLKSEDNVLVTSVYLQRIANEYPVVRIINALKWLISDWRLESIIVLVRHVCMDWEGAVGDLQKAYLLRHLTQNWAAQYMAALLTSLLTAPPYADPPAIAMICLHNPPSMGEAIQRPHPASSLNNSIQNPFQSPPRRRSSPKEVESCRPSQYNHTHHHTSSIRYPTSTGPALVETLTEQRERFLRAFTQDWDFSKLSEFFMFLQPRANVGYKFKCVLLQEAAKRDRELLTNKLSMRHFANVNSDYESDTQMPVRKEGLPSPTNVPASSPSTLDPTVVDRDETAAKVVSSNLEIRVESLDIDLSSVSLQRSRRESLIECSESKRQRVIRDEESLEADDASARSECDYANESAPSSHIPTFASTSATPPTNYAGLPRHHLPPYASRHPEQHRRRRSSSGGNPHHEPSATHSASYSLSSEDPSVPSTPPSRKSSFSCDPGRSTRQSQSMDTWVDMDMANVHLIQAQSSLLVNVLENEKSEEPDRSMAKENDKDLSLTYH